MIVDAQSSGASHPVMAGCDDRFAGAPCSDVSIKVCLVSMRVEQFNAVFLNALFNLADGAPVCAALAMDHAHAQATTPRTFIEFNVGRMHVVKKHQAVLASCLLLARAEVQQHVFRSVIAAAADEL